MPLSPRLRTLKSPDRTLLGPKEKWRRGSPRCVHLREGPTYHAEKGLEDRVQAHADQAADGGAQVGAEAWSWRNHSEEGQRIGPVPRSLVPCIVPTCAGHCSCQWQSSPPGPLMISVSLPMSPAIGCWCPTHWQRARYVPWGLGSRD